MGLHLLVVLCGVVGVLACLVLGVIVDLPCLLWFWVIWLCLVVIGFMIGCGFCFVGVGIIQILVDLWVILLDLAVWWVLVIWLVCCVPLCFSFLRCCLRVLYTFMWF